MAKNQPKPNPNSNHGNGLPNRPSVKARATSRHALHSKGRTSTHCEACR